jgi:hypothetical protein
MDGRLVFEKHGVLFAFFSHDWRGIGSCESLDQGWISEIKSSPLWTGMHLWSSDRDPKVQILKGCDLILPARSELDGYDTIHPILISNVHTRIHGHNTLSWNDMLLIIVTGSVATRLSLPHAQSQRRHSDLPRRCCLGEHLLRWSCERKRVKSIAAWCGSMELSGLGFPTGSGCSSGCGHGAWQNYGTP